ncbi:MAG: fumarylacetoacetate hydrolase family protein [Pseudomonadota bacterium]
MKRGAIIVGTVMLLLAVGLLIAWATSPDPRYNIASFEDKPLQSTIAPLEEAVTLAQFRDSRGVTHTILVTGFAGETVIGVDLVAMGADPAVDPFAALASLPYVPNSASDIASAPTITIAVSDLLASGSSGAQHIGTGTNFPEHAEEANSASVFQFPKFGTATPARTQVKAAPGILLDYEVELCMRFDRDIASPADFDAAVKGIFLCGDFTNRNALVELADPDNLDSGSGFSDAKSGPDFFPTGPFLVIPKDWSSFVRKLRMTTSVNGEPRQDARGGEMTLDFRQLTEKALADMQQPRFLYQGEYTSLAEDGKIGAGMTLMSGTAEGTIFTPPTRGDLIEGVASYIASGGPFSKRGLVETAKATFIENENSSEHFLQPGDKVQYRSSCLGSIEVKVIG